MTEQNRELLDVTDTGIGIEPEDIPHVFDRFWRTDKSRTRHTGGSGPGLAIAQHLAHAHAHAHAHDGTVTVTSPQRANDVHRPAAERRLIRPKPGLSATTSRAARFRPAVSRGRSAMQGVLDGRGASVT